MAVRTEGEGSRVSTARPIPPAVAELAREIRELPRRTRSGGRRRPWPQVADEIRRRGLGAFTWQRLARAVAALPLATHPKAPPSPAELAGLERTWRQGWEREHPGEPWPGLEEAQRRERAAAGLTRADFVREVLERVHTAGPAPQGGAPTR